jgi:chloramphenicol 3-O phosphotransferase
MPTQVIILNGGSSAGKSSIARCLQEVLPRDWLTFGADTLVEALPARLLSSQGGIAFEPDGAVATGEAFRRLDVAWARGIAAVARAGAPVVVDEVFLGGAASQARWRDAVAGLDVLWVGVRCDAGTAAAREAAREDRVAGMARAQADLVHRGVVYDLEVDSARADAAACARAIAARVVD